MSAPADRPSPAMGLLPCPFCGGGETQIHESLRPGVRMDGLGGEPISVEVLHWCPKSHAMRSHIVMVGRDEASAIAAWNRRAALARVAPHFAPKVRVKLPEWGGGELTNSALGYRKALEDVRAALRSAGVEIEGEHDVS